MNMFSLGVRRGCRNGLFLAVFRVSLDFMGYFLWELFHLQVFPLKNMFISIEPHVKGKK